MGADEITALPDALTRQTHCFVVIAAYELSVCGDAVVDCRERIVRAQPQRTARGRIGFFPASTIGQRQAVVSLGHREVRIEAKCQLELSERVFEAPCEEISAA